MQTVIRFVLVAAIAASSGAADAAPEACACKHLESLQQELENAEYLTRYFADQAKRLEAIEKRQVEINKDPTHPDSGRSVVNQTAQARDAMRSKEMKLPHPAVKGYTGPDDVKFDAETCSNKKEDLDALRNGAPCKEIGEISVAHENGHRALCLAMNKAKKNSYLFRPHSAVAAEESARYAEQAKATREILKKAVDGGKVRISEETETNVKSRGFDATYYYKTAPFDLQGKSSPSADQWTLTGDGTRTGVIKRVSFPGMSCAPYGQLNDKQSATLALDGLSMSLKLQNTSGAGDIGMRCSAPGGGQGWGQSMRPVGEQGSGEAFKDQRVKFQSEVTQDVSAMEYGKVLAQGGMAVSGYTRIKVELVCPAK